MNLTVEFPPPAASCCLVFRAQAWPRCTPPAYGKSHKVAAPRPRPDQLGESKGSCISSNPFFGAKKGGKSPNLRGGTALNDSYPPESKRPEKFKGSRVNRQLYLAVSTQQQDVSHGEYGVWSSVPSYVYKYQSR